MYPNTRLNVPSRFFSHPSNTGTTLSPELWRTWPIWGGRCAGERIESVITSAAPTAQMVPGVCLLTTFRFNNMVTAPGTAETGTRERPLAARGESLAAFDGRCIPKPPQRGCRVGDPGAPRPSRCDARLSPRAAWPRRVSGLLLLLGRLGVPFRLPLFDLSLE